MWLNRIPSRISFIVLLLGTLTCAAILSWVDRQLADDFRQGVVGLQLAFTKSQASLILTQWGQAGRELFLATVWLDYVFPAFFSCLFYVMLVRLNVRSLPSRFPSCLLLLPFAAAVFDGIENAFQILTVQNYPDFSSNLVLATGILASAKWLCLLIVLGAILSLAGRRVFKKTG